MLNVVRNQPLWFRTVTPNGSAIAPTAAPAGPNVTAETEMNEDARSPVRPVGPWEPDREDRHEKDRGAGDDQGERLQLLTDDMTDVLTERDHQSDRHECHEGRGGNVRDQHRRVLDRPQSG